MPRYRKTLAGGFSQKPSFKIIFALISFVLIVVLGVLGSLGFYLTKIHKAEEPRDLILTGPSEHIREAPGGYKIVYKNKEGDKESFSLSGFSAQDSMTDALVKFTISNSNPNQKYSPFADQGQYRHREIEVILDISGSVQRAQENDEKYIDRVLDNFKRILSSTDLNVRPGDTFRIRFLDFDKTVYRINFIGPQFAYETDAAVKFTDRPRGQIALKKQLPEVKTEGFCSEQQEIEIRTNSIDDTVNEIGCLFQSGLKRYKGSAGSSPLIDRLAEIAGDIAGSAKRDYSSITYIILTDGEFFLSSSLERVAGVQGVCGEQTYVTCHQALRAHKDQIFFENTLAISGKDDYVYFSGIDFADNPSYRNSFTKLMDTFFAPIPQENISITNAY